MSSSIFQQFKPFFTHFDDYTFFVFYGGRGGGKSENIAQILIILATQSPIRILCLREFQSSLSDSVKSLLEKWVSELDLWDCFESTYDSLRCKNGSVFIFKGMKSSNAVSIKSIADIDICWFEEAEVCSRRSFDLLLPSVLRKSNSKIIFTFNPYKDDDVVYDVFVRNTPPQRSFVCKINYDGNPYFEGSLLDLQRQHDLSTLTPNHYAHKWLGELRTFDDESLFGKVNELVSQDEYYRDSYSRVIVAIDPATTHKDFSNEYGIIVEGLTFDGIVEVIDDLSAVHTPQSFAIAVRDAYVKYQCDCCVVEVNQGGDFIKATILQLSPFLNVKEVRASRDKVHRALPVANLASMGKIKLILGGFEKLQRQMRLLSERGFNGNNGESPDRLDAFVWGCYELFALEGLDTEATLLQPDLWLYDSSYPLIESSDYWILYIGDGEVGGLKFNIRSNNETKRVKCVIDSIVFKIQNCEEALLSNNIEEAYIPNTIEADNLLVPLLKGGSTFEVDNSNIDDIATRLRGLSGVMIDDLPVRMRNGFQSQLLKTSISQYNPNSKNKDVLLYCFYYLFSIF